MAIAMTPQSCWAGGLVLMSVFVLFVHLEYVLMESCLLFFIVINAQLYYSVYYAAWMTAAKDNKGFRIMSLVGLLGK